MSDGFEFFKIDGSPDNVIALKVLDEIEDSDMAKFVAEVKKVQEAGTKARVYVDIVDFDGIEFGAAKEKLAHLGTLWSGIERLAYIVDANWMSKAIQLIDAVTPMHIRAFQRDQVDAAKSWVVE